MNKIVNHTKSYIEGNNTLIPNEDILNSNLTLEELGAFLTLFAFIDEGCFSDDELFDCYSIPKEEVIKIFKRIISKGYLEIINNNSMTEYHIYGEETVN